MRLPKVLFILKKRQLNYGEDKGSTLTSSGLLNSATFVKDMLVRNGFESKLVQVIDNNYIDREVHQYRPDIVIIEAFWVTPEKFNILHKLHPTVKWIVRSHSEIPFLQNEGIALSWTLEYAKKPNVYVSFNSLDATRDFRNYFNAVDPNGCLAEKMVYLPNYYPLTETSPQMRTRKRAEAYQPDKDIWLDFGCFGAIRPQKNHLIQAFAAVEYAESVDMRVRFHVNATRLEGMSRPDTIIKNMRSFFSGFEGKHQLVEHGWMSHSEFISLMHKMDLSLQVSFTETFNIVTADAVSSGTPVVVSNQIKWVDKKFYADPTSVPSVRRAIARSLRHDKWFWWRDINGKKLEQYSNESELQWTKVLPTYLDI